MAKGPAHAAANSIILITGTVATLALREHYSLPPETVRGVLGGLVAGLLITPDIDQAQATHEERRIYKVPVIGWLIGGVWETLWWPYTQVTVHRGALSHGPFISTAGRMFYLCLLLALARGALHYLALGLFDVYYAPPYPDSDPRWLAWWLWPWAAASIAPMYAGWALQDLMHWAMDWSLWKAFKRKG
jgi:uncharacterized metal-binding protein